MGLFDLFGGNKKKMEFDKEKSDANKKLMREVFDSHVENGSEFSLVYGYSEDVNSANFVVLRTVSYRYQSFIIGFRRSDLSIVFLEVSSDLSQVGKYRLYRPQDIKKANHVKMMGSYYLQYGSSFKKEFLNFFVTEGIDEISKLEGFCEGEFLYVDQKEEYPDWQVFWTAFVGK